MSGQSPAFPINQGTKVGNQTLPPEGPKSIPYRLDFSAQSAYLISLQYLFAQSLISNVQGVYVDNSTNTQPTTVYVDNTQQEIDVPPGAQMYVPLVLTANSQITIASQGSAAVTAKLFNFPMPFGVWYPNQTASKNLYDNLGNLQVSDTNLAPLVDPVYGLKVDVTKTVGGTAGNTNAFNSRSFVQGANSPLGNQVMTFSHNFHLNSMLLQRPANTILSGGAQLVRIHITVDGFDRAIFDIREYVPNALPTEPNGMITVWEGTDLGIVGVSPTGGQMVMSTDGGSSFVNEGGGQLYYLSFTYADVP